MWTVIHIASSRVTADNLKRTLEGEGLLVQLRQTGSGLESDGANYEILVPESEAPEAHEVITSRIVR